VNTIIHSTEQFFEAVEDNYPLYYEMYEYFRVYWVLPRDTHDIPLSQLTSKKTSDTWLQGKPI
jgi:hypothetical protein